MEIPDVMHEQDKQEPEVNHDTADPVAADPTPEEAVESAAEVVEAPEPVVPEEPSKPKLSTGLAANAHSKGASLKSLGVATQRMGIDGAPAEDAVDAPWALRDAAVNR